MSSMIDSWHLLRAGSCRHPQAMTRKGAHWCEANFPALVGLIIHKTYGPVLFDTGYDARFFAATEEFPERLYRMTTPVELPDGDSVAEQLEHYGLTPEDIRHVVLSHFHGDHVAGLKAFDRAHIHCARKGLQRIRSGGRFNRVRQGLLSALVPDDLETRARFFEDVSEVALHGLEPFETGVDLFDDGSLIMVELAGHCPGHWGLWLRCENVFFIGDAAWSIRSVAENIAPPRLTTSLLGETRPYRATLSKLNRLHHAGQVAIIPSHCEITALKWLKP